MSIKTFFGDIRNYFTGNNGGGGGQSFLSWFFGGFPSVSKSQALDEYKNLAYSCINAISEEVAKYEPIIYLEDDKTQKPIDHPFKRLLANPNGTIGKFEFMLATQAYRELNGEIFWYIGKGEITKFPRSLDTIRPDRIRVAIDEKTGEVVGYICKRDDGIEIPLDVDEIIHFKSFDPKNPYRGKGPVEAGILYIDTDNHASEFQNKFLKNQSSPSGIVTLSGTIGKDAFDKAKRLWKEEQGGLENAGKTLFLRGTEAKFEKIGLSISDINLGDLNNVTEARVRKVFRVPKPLLGDIDATGLGRANIEAIEYIFIARVIDPKLISIDDTLTVALRKLYKNNKLKVKHKSQIPVNQEAKTSEWNSGVDRWYTRNEIRAEQGLAPIVGGDKLYLSFNQVATDDPQTTSSETKSFGHFILKSKKSDRYRKLADKLVQLEKKQREVYDSAFVKLVSKQEKYVVGKLEEQSGKKLVKAYEHIMPNEEDEAIKFTTIIIKILEKLMMLSGELTLEFLGKPDEAFVLEQAVRDIALSSTKRLMVSFNKETALNVEKQLLMGLQNGESTEQLIARVRDIYTDAKEFRATRLVDTEVHLYTNYAASESYRQAGYKDLIWKTLPGACEYCLAMEGTVVKIGEPFVHVGETITGTDGGEMMNDYQDINYCNAHPHCNCYPEPK